MAERSRVNIESQYRIVSALLASWLTLPRARYKSFRVRSRSIIFLLDLASLPLSFSTPWYRPQLLFFPSTAIFQMRPFHSIRVINLLKRNIFTAYARAINLSRNKRVCKNRLSYSSYEIRISILRIVETLPSLSDRYTYAVRSCTNIYGWIR